MGKKEIAIKVDNLSIRYKSLKSFSIKQNFLRFHKNKRETFEALKNISFEVEEGEILGIIGKNGSGKSTLLRSLPISFLQTKERLIRMDIRFHFCRLVLDFRNSYQEEKILYYRECFWDFRKKKFGQK